ncbi:MATE family efflux transporter [Halobacteriales archaeon QS_8_69_26]|nr:MAG: MATE family efflux transporter [Halobacteriales archaeon QS_8_69_26]
MLTTVRRWTRDLIFKFPDGLARLGIVDREKGEEAFDLAVPAMVTGGMRTILRFADFFMVSLAVGEVGVAALEFGFQYYFVAFGLALALTSGTISVVSRFKGAGEDARADLAIKQSLWLSLAISIPLAAVSWVYAEPLIDVLTNDPETIAKGAIYLQIVMLAAAPRFWSMTAARALAGAGDTRTPMYVRLVTLPTNVALNAVLIFGLFGFPELGVAGAAWGTAIANTLAAAIFFGIFLSGRWAVGLRVRGTQFDASILKELVRVATPLAGTRLAQTFSRFPFLFVLGALGTPVVAAYAIGRRVILLAMMPAWGYSTASSTLVGQAIGAGEDREATEYGWQTLRIALATQMLIAVVLVALARPITLAFGAESVGLTVDFIRMFGLSVAGFSVSRVMRGGLRGAGDTRWPLYGTFTGTVVVRLPIAFVALPAGVVSLTVAGYTLDPGLGLGVGAVFAAILADMYVRAGVNLFRFRSGEWQRVARESGVGADADPDAAD